MWTVQKIKREHSNRGASNSGRKQTETKGKYYLMFYLFHSNYQHLLKSYWKELKRIWSSLSYVNGSCTNLLYVTSVFADLKHTTGILYWNQTVIFCTQCGLVLGISNSWRLRTIKVVGRADRSKSYL